MYLEAAYLRAPAPTPPASGGTAATNIPFGVTIAGAAAGGFLGAIFGHPWPGALAGGALAWLFAPTEPAAYTDVPQIPAIPGVTSTPPDEERQAQPAAAPPAKAHTEPSADKYTGWNYTDIYYCVEWTWLVEGPTTPSSAWVLANEGYGHTYGAFPGGCAAPFPDPPPYRAYHWWSLMADPQSGGTEWKDEGWNFNY